MPLIFLVAAGGIAIECYIEYLYVLAI